MSAGGQSGAYKSDRTDNNRQNVLGQSIGMQDFDLGRPHGLESAFVTAPSSLFNGAHSFPNNAGLQGSFAPPAQSTTEYLSNAVSGASDSTSKSLHDDLPASAVAADSSKAHMQRNSQGKSDAASASGQHVHGPAGEDAAEEQAGSHTNDVAGNGDDAQTAPAWSEMKTKAGKDRKRLPLACIACRRKKIRCSGESPACKHCLRSRIPCVYKVTTRKAAPRTDYMAMLDRRLKRMEDRVIRIIPREEQQDAIDASGRAVVKPSLPSGPSKSSNIAKKRAAEQAFGDELEEWANGNAKSGSLPDQALSRDRTTADEHSLLLEGADKLPDRDLQEHLSEVFFDYVYGQSYHLLHKPSFMRKLTQGTVPPVLMLAVCAISARFSNHPSVRTEPAFLRGEDWARAARDISFRRYDKPNITILIVYLILGLHEFGTCHGGRSWMFGGMAQRMAYALQLHKDLRYDPGDRTSMVKTELTFTDREIRRRTMWSCFLMDRFNSSGTDRPIFVGQQYVRAQLPIKEDFYLMELTGPTEDLEGHVPNPVESDLGDMPNAKENMGIAAYLIRLVAIWGSLISYINLGGKESDPHSMWAPESKFMDIKRAIGKWEGSLPVTLKYDRDNIHNHASEKIANQFLFLHLVHNQILCFMNQFALPSPSGRPRWPRDMPMSFRTEAGRIALEAATQISRLAHESMEHNVVAPFAGYAAFFSSTIHIPLAFSKNSQQATLSKQCLSWNVKFLTKMKRYWGTFSYMSENLRDQYRRHADAAKHASSMAGKHVAVENEMAESHSSSDGERGKIFQYGDWFDRYPHGVSGTDYDEPANDGNAKEPGADAVLGQKSDLQTVEEFFAKLSPPSRAARLLSQSQPQSQQTQKIPGPGPRKRRQSTKNEGSTRRGSQRTQSDGTKMSGLQIDGDQMRMTQVLEDSSPLQQEPRDAMQGILQHSSALLPHGLQQSHNPMLMDSQQLPQPFTGVPDPNTATNQMQPINPADMLDSYGMTAVLSAGNGFWGNPSTAWFEPYNLDPPMHDGSAMFGGMQDWTVGTGNAMGAFGDFSDLGMMPEGFAAPDANVAGNEGFHNPNPN